MNKRRGILYGVLVVLLLVMGIWWLYFLTEEATTHAQFRKQKLANDRLHAAFLLQSNPRIKANPEHWLNDSFPHLVFRRNGNDVEVDINPTVLANIDNEARRTRNMFFYEGLFFIVLLVSGSIILVFSWRSEARFVQARELFLAGATHEFKTPLASLKLYAETLGRDNLKPEDQANIRGRMVKDVGRLERLVNEVLAMSAADSFSTGPPDAVDLVKETKHVIDDLKAYALDHEARIAFHFEGDHVAWGHEVPFSLALRNLVVNAINHSEGGVDIEVNLTRLHQWHHLTVKDNGPGIPRRLQRRVFDCFYSGKPDGSPAGGTGLGLYLAKRNVQAMGGKITLESEEGRGCAFTLILPAHMNKHALRAKGDPK